MKIKVEQKEIELDKRIIKELENFHSDGNSLYNKKLKSAFNIISVKDDNDVIKASDSFNKLNIEVIDDKNEYLKKAKKDPITNYFLIRDGQGWRLQSHYIGFGMNTDDLEKCVNYIIDNNGVSNNNDYMKERIKSRIKELKEGKKLYDNNKKSKSRFKADYTKKAQKYWENANYLIEELERLI